MQRLRQRFDNPSTRPIGMTRAIRRRARRPLPPGGERRRGMVLIVVMGLLGLLMLLGFAFFTFSRQEEGNAEYYNARAKQVGEFVSPNVLFDWSLEQLIKGAPDELNNSVFYGGRHALLPNMVGTDSAPYSSAGINIGYDATTGEFFVDQNFDGQPDNGQNGQPDNRYLFVLADSPSAVATSSDVGNKVGGQVFTSFPDPDTDYTYPDINNAFLALNGFGLNGANQPVRTIIPSFLCPQYLRQLENDGNNVWTMRPYPIEDFNGNGRLDAGEDRNGNEELDDWYITDDTRRLVMRPHAKHMHVAPDGTVLGRRYLLNALDANGNLRYGVAPFPIAPHASVEQGEEWGSDSVPGEMGVWSLARWRANWPYKKGEVVVEIDDYSGWGFVAQGDGTSGGTEPAWNPPAPVTDNGVTWQPVQLGSDRRPHYEFDADPDGDGIKEAVYLDLDFPVQTTPDGTNRKFVPMFAFTVYDADGLLNLIAHGNLEGFNGTQLFRSGDFFGMDTEGDSDGTADGLIDFLSQSNVGASVSEINPLWGLTAGFNGISGDTTQHQYFFGRTPSSWQELANMEFFLSRVGKLEYDTTAGNDSTVKDRFPGLFGEVGQTLAVGSTSPRPNNLGETAFPRPGASGTDDNGNLNLGEPTGTYDPYQTYRQPLDYLGIGRNYNADGGRSALTLAMGAPRTTGPAGLWQMFENFPTTRGTIPWNSYLGNSLAVNPIQALLMDEAYELNPDHDDPIHDINSPTDDLMPIADNAFLQMGAGDVGNLDLTAARIARLLEYNLTFDPGTGAGNPDAEAIRKRFTTLSSDLKTFGTSYYGPYGGPDSENSQRRWEFTPEFPPSFAQAPNDQQPFRLALRQALRVTPGDRDTTDIEWRQRILNMNGVTMTPNNYYADPDGDFENSRPLTPHPTGLTDALVQPIAVGTDPSARWRNPNNPHDFSGLVSGTDFRAQEAWARYDRQLMARDIYVMLYTLGGGHDGLDYTGSNRPALNDPARENDQAYADDPANWQELPAPDQLDARQRDLNGDGKIDNHEIKYFRALYDDDQLHEMAQFAINVVDRLDPDNVIDCFEYDKDLSDGWNLDDDPYDAAVGAEDTLDAGLSEKPQDRGHVFGVETQELTFSEVAGFMTEKVENAGGTGTEDLKATFHVDTRDNYWMYIELRNASPFKASPAIPPASRPKYETTIKGQWRIELEFKEGAVTKSRVLTLGTDPTRPITVPGGESLTIMSKSIPDGGHGAAPRNDITGELESSEFKVDLNYQGTGDPAWDRPEDVIVPYDGATTFDLLPGENFTLTDASGGTTYPALLNVHPTTAADSMAELIAALPAATREVRLLLRRRANPDRPNVTDDDDNPWITVDEWDLGSWTLPRRLDLKHDDLNGEHVARKIDEKEVGQSVERRQRLHRDDTVLYADTDVAGADTKDVSTYRAVLVTQDNYDEIKFHTLGLSNSIQNYNLYQIHGDRDYYSVSEWLTVPLYGPEQLTEKLNEGAAVGSNDAFRRGVNTAGAERFLRPLSPKVIFGQSLLGAGDKFGKQDFDDDGDTVKDEADEFRAAGSDDRSAKYDNRWYRLLGLWELPSVVDGANDLRSHGLINLNGIRHPEVLAGLIDDPYAFNFARFNPLREGSQTSYLPDTYEFIPSDPSDPDSRDWWKEFLLARDGGWDAASGLILPGNPGARPFRPLTFAGNQHASLEDTALRSLYNEQGTLPVPQPARRLFELRAPAGTPQGVEPEFGSQHRLLSKILNNTTTRSNVFFVFVQVDFFEVLEIPGGLPDPDSPDPNNPTIVPAGYVLQKIGGKLPESPGHRGFFVIDRSLALAPDPNNPAQTRLKPRDLPQPDDPAAFTIQQSFDFRELVRARLIIR